ncbi:MAG: three-Cys-motif partner protein TcmP [Acidobacteria bacterium]|nr:three-Cys-motif partner protein TcmP [Acidobacteriota bacterium]
MTARKSKQRGATPRFGGDWTTCKLNVLGGYLRSYTTALRDKPTATKPFRKAYIDAFAGTGYRDERSDESRVFSPENLLLPDLAGPEPASLLDGSARIALQTEPGFDKYIFIERSPGRCAGLAGLKDEFSLLADAIDIREGDANDHIREICAKDWSAHRAVLFLDPYGMQVEWTTIEAIAKTEAIDLWLLFPLGIGVNRMLTRSGDIPESWRRRLDLLLGTQTWYDEFYAVEHTQTLFGDSDRVVKATMATIGRYFNNRLGQIFSGVAKEPGVLRNSANNPLYLLCFAAGNERGSEIGLRIANHLLKEMR